MALTLVSCGASLRPRPDAQPHLDGDWIPYRARSLGLDDEATLARDLALAESTPPPLDQVTVDEGAALFRALCAGCHGATGRLEGVPAIEPAPRRWGGMGATMGFFFGGDAMRAGLYKKIRDGGEKMPAWGELLSREQTWALVAHLESL